jgi:hypothetical protein
MKTYRTTSGPFSERPYYKDEEIEQICSAELRAAGLYPTAPGPIRIDRFIEKRFGVTPRYEELGENVLGFTMFGARGVQDVVVAKALEDEGTQVAERRIRTTLAHEVGHGLLHAHLFSRGCGSQPLFGDFTDPQRPKVLCRDIPVRAQFTGPDYGGRWWEFQANRAIGPLLMPANLMRIALVPFLEPVGSLGMESVSELRRNEAARKLADIFAVNPAVSKIRLQDVYPITTREQMTL